MKKAIYRKLGMRIGENVHIYQGAKLDIIFSKLIEIGDNSTIGGEVQIYNHSAVASKDYFGWGIVKIGKNCTIGNGSVIAGIKMGDGSSLKPCTVTAGYLFNIPENTIYGGNPPQLIKRIG
jgi:acetyltransferase-like isoleucine patch superfamily enzyme